MPSRMIGGPAEIDGGCSRPHNLHRSSLPTCVIAHYRPASPQSRRRRRLQPTAGAPRPGRPGSGEPESPRAAPSRAEDTPAQRLRHFGNPPAARRSPQTDTNWVSCAHWAPATHASPSQSQTETESESVCHARMEARSWSRYPTWCELSGQMPTWVTVTSGWDPGWDLSSAVNVRHIVLTAGGTARARAPSNFESYKCIAKNITNIYQLHSSVRAKHCLFRLSWLTRIHWVSCFDLTR